ncbi:TetR/AcrR family transcriptional regulator [Enterovirga sp.]|uniref:TetR/AcrR family transcriptional regulator n=1 Tax=Enterovirga sp. TaxID=2026350 RepID=UPI002C1FEEA5|nr:TetR/AcrR family transcriptional regulator [Enterovirga sp.]HMO31176.1 TetR/AcrR family transcriptional regulator [Enterovirga sp.]
MSEPMAPEPAAGRKAAPTKSKPAGAPPDKRRLAVEALMRLASDRPWSDIEIADVAHEAGISLSEMRDLFPSKGAMLEGFTRMIDKIVIEGTSEDLVGEPARERIFDVIMRRLDAMTPYRDALRRIAWAMRGEVASLPALNRMALNSARYMLAAAGVPTEGPLGFVKLQGFVLAEANVMQTWFEDDDPTLAKTMARLDRELGRGERVLERAEDVRRLTAPFRAFGQALMDGRDRMRRRAARQEEERRTRESEREDPAAAI